MAEEEVEEGYFLDFVIGPLAGIFEAFEIEHEKAVKYAKGIVYGGIGIGAIVLGLKIYRFIRG